MVLNEFDLFSRHHANQVDGFRRLLQGMAPALFVDPSLRRFEEMQRWVDSVVMPISDRFEEIERANLAIAESASSHFDDVKRLAEVVSPVSDRFEEIERANLAIAESAAQQFEKMELLRQPFVSPASRQIEEICRISASMAESVVAQIASLDRLLPIENLSFSLAATARWACWLSEQTSSIARPLAVLSTTPDSELAGTFSWRSGGTEQPQLDIGIWSTEEETRGASTLQSYVVEVRFEVFCWMCGTPIIVENSTSHLTSGGELAAKISVVPWCPHCLRASNDDPGYESVLFERLQDLEQGSRGYSLIKGGGDSSEPARGRQVLRLVTARPTADEEEPGDD